MFGLRLRSEHDAEERFDHLFTEMWDSAYRVAFFITRDPQLAEDAVQEGFLAIWSNMSKLSTISKVGPWVRTIVGNCARRIRRRAQRTDIATDPATVESVATSVSDGADPLGALLRRSDRDAIRDGIRELTPKQRQVIYLKYYEDLPDPEIASLLRCPLGTVKSRLDSARRQLVKRIRDKQEGVRG